MKNCARCSIDKEPSEFSKDKSRKDGLHSYCKDCHKVYWKNKPKDERYRANRVKANRKQKCKRRGITVKQYEQMLKEQDGLCAICEKICLVHPNLSIDHCHDTGSVRGLLCMKCNTGLGKFENIKQLKKAIAYLEKSNARGCLQESP